MDAAAWEQAKAVITAALRRPPSERERFVREQCGDTPLAGEIITMLAGYGGDFLAETTAADPGGFGLGVSQMTDPALGTVWAYLGSTLGFRFLLIYLPRSGSSIAIGVNSLPDQDQLPLLAPSVYRILHRAGLS